jgi:integrase
MARPNTGEVTQWPWKDGKTITYGAALRLRPSPPTGVRHQHAGLERRLRRDRARVDPAAGRARHLGAAGEEDIGRADGGRAARRPSALRTICSESRRREEEPRSRRQHDRRPRVEARLSDRALRAVKPDRTFLEVDELLSLLDAAGELDGAARRDRRVGRRAALVTLGLSGFRISELCDMRCSQVDLARARFKLPDAKTPKGVREVEMTLWNRGELVRHREQRLRDGFPMELADHFFGTANGRRRDPDRFRGRVLARLHVAGLPADPQLPPDRPRAPGHLGADALRG